MAKRQSKPAKTTANRKSIADAIADINNAKTVEDVMELIDPEKGDTREQIVQAAHARIDELKAKEAPAPDPEKEESDPSFKFAVYNKRGDTAFIAGTRSFSSVKPVRIRATEFKPGYLKSKGILLFNTQSEALDWLKGKLERDKKPPRDAGGLEK